MTDVLVVEPWFGGSHRDWAEGYARHSRHRVTLLTLPAEGFKWRLRGAALTLAHRVERRPDVVLASSLLDVAAFTGHARRLLAGAPVVLYMHENQLTYPVPSGVRPDTSLALINWNSMAAADVTVFNSDYHRREWFANLEQLLATHPEPRHLDCVDPVRDRSVVLPVGVELGWLGEGIPPKARPPLVIWNQRWEHDKAPELVAGLLAEVDKRAGGFRVALCGESPIGEIPPALHRLRLRLGERVVQFGYAERDRYRELLSDAGVVVSAAHHEFFGVAVVEAMAAGAVPVLPDRLSYPELLGETGLALYRCQGEAVERVAELVTRPDPALAARAARAGRAFGWRQVAPRYDDLLARVAGK